MIKYDIEFDDDMWAWVVVAYQPCQGGHVLVGEVVYACSYIIDAEHARDNMIRDNMLTAC